MVANVLGALGSVFLVVQLVRIPTPPADAVTIGVPFEEEWQVVNGGRSTLTNAHWTLDVERNVIDLVQLVDGKTDRAPPGSWTAVRAAPLTSVAGWSTRARPGPTRVPRPARCGRW